MSQPTTASAHRLRRLGERGGCGARGGGAGGGAGGRGAASLFRGARASVATVPAAPAVSAARQFSARAGAVTGISTRQPLLPAATSTAPCRARGLVTETTTAPPRAT